MTHQYGSTRGRHIPGRVVGQHSAPRSYVVETPSGLLRRNCHHLNPSPNLELSEPVTYSDNTEHMQTSASDDNTEEPPPRPIITRSKTGATIAMYY